MRNVTIKQAESDLGALLDAAAAGEEVVIAKENGPAVRLVVVATAATLQPVPRRKLGQFKDEIRIGPDFDAPLPDDIQAYFEGRGP